MAGIDPAFRAIPRNATYFVIWRIENMQVVPLARDHYGTFYTGDSYIAVCITEAGEKGDSLMKIKEVRGNLDVHIHFWLGAETSQDEAGVAAYKTVELDEYLGGTPVQHREVQGWESKRFLSYFKQGIRLLEGGISSGISNMNNNIKSQMFKVRGKQRPIVQQMADIDWQYMDDGAIYIICSHSIIFVWTGRNANATEKIQGVNVAQQMKTEYESNMIILVEDGKEQSLPKNEKEIFNQLLPINQKKVKNYKDAVMNGKKVRTSVKLYRCVDEGGTLKVTEVKTGPIDQHDLNCQDSYIIDNGEAGIWVWVGKKASLKERTEAMRNAQGFIKKKGYPNHTQVTRVIDGGEPAEFKAQFRSWRDNVSPPIGKQHNTGKIAKTVQTKFDAATLHTNRHLAAESQMVDDGSGSKEVFCIQQADLIPLEMKEHGKFYSGNCYVILYAFSTDDRDHFMIYYWLGRDSLKDEQEIAALKTMELDQRLKGLSVLTRVVEGKEPPHLLAIFRGRMITFQDRDTVGIQNGITNGQDTNHSYLLHVQGTSEFTTKANQVQKCAASLNSYDVFVLLTKDIVYIWAGKRSTGDEREMAKRIASQSGREVVLVSEGQEKEDFWNAIGGRENYDLNKRCEEEMDTRQPRFFQCAISSGHLDIHEILGFDQNDLVEDDVIIVDAWNTVFVWMGHCIKTEERRLSISIAEEYLYTDPSGRDLATPIVIVKQGYEPPNFTGFFNAWDNKFWNNKKSYEQIKLELAEENSGIVLVQQVTSKNDLRQDVDKFPIEILQIKDAEQLPQGIDPSHKEIHLTDDDFHQAFGMSYTEFQGLPRWKQLELKKAVDLF